MIKLSLTQERDPIQRIQELVNNLKTLEEFASNIDLSEIHYLTPLTILPIAAKITKLSENCNISLNTPNSLSSIFFPEGTTTPIADDNKNQMPICHVNLIKPEMNRINLIERISTEYDHFIIEYLKRNQEVSENYRGSISYLISELCDNVIQHSEAENFWIFSQFWPTRGELEICLLDDGLGLKGCYDRRGIGTSSHYDALSQAIEGKSSKLETPNERGYGIGTNINLFCSSELQGEFTLISGNACYHNSSNIVEPKLGTIPINWQGTIISARLMRPTTRVDILKYISK